MATVAPFHRRCVSSRGGLTLVEMMVSLACVILLMLAYTQLFSDVGGRITDARSMIELEHRMQTATQRLRSDLQAHTCELLPWRDPAAGGGYFEIIEGPLRDFPSPIPGDNPSTLWDESHPILGDTDDVLMFTIRSKDGPFTGKYWHDANGNGSVDAGEVLTVQSEVAEVVWFLRPTLKADGVTQVDPPTFTLYRRTFLVMPTYQNGATPIAGSVPGGSPLIEPTTFYDNNDLSVSVQINPSGNKVIANSLGDLCKRECRYGHTVLANAINGFPHQVDPRWLVPFGGTYDPTMTPAYTLNASKPRFGEDVVLTNVLAFDVQVWDPAAPVQMSTGVAVTPGDAGYTTGGTVSATGAFVDLNWGNATFGTPGTTAFQSKGHSKSQLVANFTATPPVPATYDTWSTHYEHDGLDQDGDGTPDQGTDGFDNNSDGVVDDANERETSPPYPVPLRGLRVKIRCYEPDARQVHEVTVVESFVPE